MKNTELGVTTTPENDNQNEEHSTPDNQSEDWEKRFKDTQSAFTKAQNEKVEIARIAVEANPSTVEQIPDEKVRNKIIKDKWGADNLEELKILYPDFNKSNKDEEDELDKTELLERKVKIMEYNINKTKTKDAVSQAMTGKYADYLKTIPNAEGKVYNELKNISDKLSAEDRVDRAIRLVVNSSSNDANAYALIQGVGGVVPKASNDEKKVTIDKNDVKSILNGRRI